MFFHELCAFCVLICAFCVLTDRKVELLLVNRRVARDVDRSEIVFDLNQHISLTRTSRLRHVRIDSQRHLFIVGVAVQTLREPARIFE